MIFDSLYATLFRPAEGPLDLEGASGVAIFALLALSLALPDAGRLQTGWGGALGLFVLLLGVCLASWFWVGAAMALLARTQGGQGTIEATLGAISQACWPLLLVAPAVAIGNAGWPRVEHGIVVAVAIWVAVLLVAFVRRVHAISWSRSLGAWVILVGATLASGLVMFAATGVLALILATT